MKNIMYIGGVILSNGSYIFSLKGELLTKVIESDIQARSDENPTISDIPTVAAIIIMVIASLFPRPV